MSIPSTPITRHRDVYPFIGSNQFTNSLNEKTVLVTGAGRGVGRSIAMAFAAAGANVVCLARTANEVDAVAAEISASGHQRVLSVSADITCPAQLHNAMAQVKKTFGDVDILVNNAGIDRIGSLQCEEDFSVWWRVVEVNLKGSAACIHHVLPHLVQQNSGAVINIGSRNAISTYRYMTAYSAAKTALLRMCQCLQLDLKDTNVNIFYVQPGNVATTLTRGACNSTELRESPDLQAYMGDMQQSMTGSDSDSPRLVANTCVFLAAHDEARLLRGLYLDAKQDMGELIAEAKKGQESRIKLERLQYLKADLL